MPKHLTTRGRKRSEFEKLIEEYHALLVLSGQYSVQARHSRRAAIAKSSSLTNRELDGEIAFISADLAEIREVLKPTQPASFYVDFVKRAEGTLRRDQHLYLPKWRLAEFFRGLRGDKRFEKLPEHALVALDVHGISRAVEPAEVRILEAGLYEDMCAMFNRAWELTPLARHPNVSKLVLKEAAAARRASVLAAFYMIEAYLNSIAFDHLVRHERELSAQDLDRITEWDNAKRRERLVSFRDKLLSYPRIILGLQHPPIQENNCPEVAFLLREAKDFRDAIVHANPRPERSTTNSPKEIRFWRIGSVTPFTYVTGSSTPTPAPEMEDPSEWVQVVDCAIAVVEKIECLLYGDASRLFWLKRRQSEGPFDPTVFD